MDIRNFTIQIEWSYEDEAFIAQVLELPGCVSHGEFLLEAAENIQEAFELYCESSERNGDKLWK